MKLFKRKKSEEAVVAEEVEVTVEKKKPSPKKKKAVVLEELNIKELYAYAESKGIKLARGLTRKEAVNMINKKLK
jgi:hypothetical protein